ncbi:hypothetical protein F5148DRAFT_1186114 [Russula earlei]|uniref:Uncharacterized protein n=1 Tax=Russula earlei TaxID=71964 RepID=A0ACC0UD54_9AGAM|nr:hypothetical protein F5148DRAFT_1186114 [Russula earlei]
MSYYTGSQSLPAGRSIYPATVQQLLRARQKHTQSKFYIDGMELDMVTCVAHLVQIGPYHDNSGRAYFVEDGSAGRLRVSQFSWSESNPLLEGSLKEHIYVRVMGRLKNFNGKNQLIAVHIRPVLDMHEPFFHCLEAMVAFVSRQKRISLSAHTAPTMSRSPRVTQQHTTPMQTDSGTDGYFTPQASWADFENMPELGEIDRLTLLDHHSDEHLHNPEFVQEPSLPSQSPPLSSTSPPLEANNLPSLLRDPYSALSSLQRDIIIKIQENAPLFPTGVPIKALYMRIGRSTDCDSELKIRQAIEEMMEDGLLYSTIDENHFKMKD